MLLTSADFINVKCYRLTNKNECHNGFQYRDGLNVDTIPFTPEGQCQPGGLYFFSDVQLAECIQHLPSRFIPFYVREVTFPPDAKIWKMDGKYKADKFILGERRTLLEALADLPWSADIIQYAGQQVEAGKILAQNPHVNQSTLLEYVSSWKTSGEDIMKIILEKHQVHGTDNTLQISDALKSSTDFGCYNNVKLLIEFDWTDPSAEQYVVLRYAALHGRLDIVERLLADPRVDSSVAGYAALINAARKGHLNVVILLLAEPKVDPSASLQVAAECEHLEIVKLLLADPRVDPTADDNRALIRAAQSGHVEVVKLLLADPRVDPTADDNSALHEAVLNCRLEVVKQLLADPRVDPSLAKGNDVLYMASIFGYLDIVNVLLGDSRITPTVNIVLHAASRHKFNVVDRLLADPRINLTYQDAFNINRFRTNATH